MNRRVKELIVFFIKEYPRPLNRTELVKMLYLFEYYHVQNYECQYSELAFIRHVKGPYTEQIPCVVHELCMEGALSETPFQTSYRKIGYLHAIKDPQLAYAYDLPDEQKFIAMYIIDKTKNLRLKKILEFVYATPPMGRIIEEEEESGIEEIGRGINLSEKMPVLKFSKVKIEAAKRRLDLSSSGTQEEYYQHIVEEWKALEPSRRRANMCLLK